MNIHLDAHEHGDDIVFMHAVQEGAASKSFGIQVAKLAGLPKEILNFAKQKLRHLEATGDTDATSQNVETQIQQMPLIDMSHSEVADILQATDLDDLSPRQAWDLLNQLKAKLN